MRLFRMRGVHLLKDGEDLGAPWFRNRFLDQAVQRWAVGGDARWQPERSTDERIGHMRRPVRERSTAESVH